METPNKTEIEILREALQHLAKYGKQCDVKFIASRALAKAYMPLAKTISATKGKE
jgi:hypothetical protein